MDLMQPGNPRCVMLGMCLQMWSHLCGITNMHVLLLVIIDCLTF